MVQPSTPLKIGIAGALGRMGRAMAAVLEGRQDAVVTALVDRPDAQGQAVGNLTIGGRDGLAGCDPRWSRW